MSAAAATDEVSVSLVAALDDDGHELTPRELSLVQALAPHDAAIAQARDKRHTRAWERQRAAAVADAAATERTREELAANRRAKWEGASPLVRALHLAAQDEPHGATARLCLRLAEMLQHPDSMLRRRKRDRDGYTEVVDVETPETFKG